jgi:hypothetical protein
MSKMNGKPKGPQAARMRKRKLELLRRFPIPEDLLPGAQKCNVSGGAANPYCAVKLTQSGLN